MSDKRKPLWPWIAALLIGLLLLYVASFGPACWVNQRTGRGGRLLVTTYRPLLWIADSLHWYRPLEWYTRLGISDSNLWPWFLDNEKAETTVWSGPD